ncbi:hypothetical protein M6D93_16990 [Jatrophihabitans telluris]|uniref:Uncharacterized protein n=1 Tax=Jatrophihabitans telluris TaxID=2038343 RepID=A0ABY4QWH5_9ACTN|nr:hypothetical protein [Jatrophihabitans telluris]UQX87979.1 hypothetical protein M6D93_16990 [Jatrophihabitans telluris]
MFRPSVLVLAALLTSPAIYSAFVTGSMSVSTALVRFLIALPVSAIMVVGFNGMTSAYQQQAKRARLQKAIDGRANADSSTRA